MSQRIEAEHFLVGDVCNKQRKAKTSVFSHWKQVNMCLVNITQFPGRGDDFSFRLSLCATTPIDQRNKLCAAHQRQLHYGGVRRRAGGFS